jgi:hypothetical protein
VSWAGQTPQDIASQYGFVDAEGYAEPWALGEPGPPSTLGGLVEFEAQVTAEAQAGLSPTQGFRGAWAPIEAQLTSEFATIPDIQGAKTAFADAYSQMNDQLGVAAQDALQGAQRFVMIGKTIAGAAGTVSDLVQAAGAATTSYAAAQFVGSMIGTLGTLTVALGATGVGAAICGIAEGLLAIMQSAGLFGHPSAGTLPGCSFVSCTGEWVVGCLCCTSGERVSPGAGNWRSFPTDDGTTTDDAGWFAQNCFWQCKDFSWRGTTWRNDFTANPLNRTSRPIDYAFGTANYSLPYEAVEFYAKGQSAAAADAYWSLPVAGALPSDFLRAFATAWKSNAEYGLNGLHMQDESLVLTHTLKLWNRSHDGPQVPLTLANADSLLLELVGLGFNSVGATDPDIVYPGLAPIAAPSDFAPPAGNPPSAFDSFQGQKTFFINTGPLKQVALTPDVAAMQSAAAGRAADAAMAAQRAAAAAEATNATPATGGATTAIVATAATAAAAGGLWFLLGQPMTIAALKAAASEAVHAISGAFRR